MHKSPFKNAAWLWLVAGVAGVHNPSRDLGIRVHIPLPDRQPTRSCARSCAGWGQGGPLSGQLQTSLLPMEGAVPGHLSRQ